MSDFNLDEKIRETKFRMDCAIIKNQEKYYEGKHTAYLDCRKLELKVNELEARNKELEAELSEAIEIIEHSGVDYDEVREAIINE